LPRFPTAVANTGGPDLRSNITEGVFIISMPTNETDDFVEFAADTLVTSATMDQ